MQVPLCFSLSDPLVYFARCTTYVGLLVTVVSLCSAREIIACSTYLNRHVQFCVICAYLYSAVYLCYAHLYDMLQNYLLSY